MSKLVVNIKSMMEVPSRLREVLYYHRTLDHINKYQYMNKSELVGEVLEYYFDHRASAAHTHYVGDVPQIYDALGKEARKYKDSPYNYGIISGIINELYKEENISRDTLISMKIALMSGYKSTELVMINDLPDDHNSDEEDLEKSLFSTV